MASTYDFVVGCGAAGVSGGLAVAVMNPLDTLKVRYQVSASSVAMRPFALEIVAAEGLWGGLYAPGILANFLIGISSMGRVGCYPYVRDAMLDAAGASEKNAPVMFSPACSPAASATLLRARYIRSRRAQAEAGAIGADGVLTSGASKGEVPRFHGRSLAAGLAALGADGALLRGSGALMARGALLSAGMQLGYDGCKTASKRYGFMDEGFALHAAAQRAWAARTRGSSLACAAAILKADGPLAFYRGFAFVRLAPVFVVSR
ncbi:thiosulfate transmembrane transporter [Aureococcus anophagefferens]|nr:thiosulfate transmembrane transporter [Aureococcus anophagefferens]